ncbi:hypothetical protein NP233_g287 [Leucocoprinus birnbaumii]|uniref:Uncharacterized protein n=1 Tax=Leucocoprinus birnbaumii TaxID=56174 RepID=A0AAD5Z0D1_9AGAR|nr:hypothetical protein NP233_g287 [Leucocoprinus birnbaumii]
MMQEEEDIGHPPLSPLPITTGDVAVVLQHICPPSAHQRVPAHLLSLPLLQRHHFLSISPDDPAAYLTWPDSDSQRVLALLEEIRPEDLSELLPAHVDATDALIRYAADPEAVYAHVRISSTPIHPSPSLHPDSEPSLRLVFLWDQPSSSWRYHNSAIGDFPKGSHSDLSHAMTLFHSPDDFLPERTYTLSVDNFDDDDDAYWNAYGTGEPLQSAPVKSVPGADTEDAYWAQYASIQGSADSTIPSPRPRDRQLQPIEGDQRVFVPSTELNPDLLHGELYNPLAPPSPSSLSRRLASLPTRPDSPPLHEEDDASSASASATSPSPQSPHPDLDEGGEPSIVLPPAANDTAQERTQTADVNYKPADEALKGTIRGLYQLWRSGERSQQDFMALVKQSIEEQSL